MSESPSITGEKIWLDGKFETKPWLLIGGILLGTATGFVQMFRMAKRFLK